MFVRFCKCKDCVLFPSLMFHNELVNVVSARLLLTAAICFVQAVAQLLKPHIMDMLHLTNWALRWSCAWMKSSQGSQFVNCMPWAIIWWEYKPTQCSRKSFTYVSIFSCSKVHLLSMWSNWYRPQGSISSFTIYLPVGLVEEQGWGTNLRSQAAWIVRFRLRQNINKFYPKTLPLLIYE